MKINTVERASQRVLEKDGTPKFHCNVCREPIKPGESYTWAQGRFTDKRVACWRHHLRPSMLTGSDKLARLYEAQEAIEDAVEALRASELDEEAWEQGEATCIGEVTPDGLLDDIRQALEDASQVAEEVGSEYSEAADAMGSAGEQNQERADYCDEWRNALDSASIATWEPFPKGDETFEEMSESYEEWKEEQIGEAEQAASALEI